MNDTHTVSGKIYLSANEIARAYGFSRDYVARLARTGEVNGAKAGKKWYIDPDAFKSYHRALEKKKILQRDALVAVRKKEYVAPRVAQVRVMKKIDTQPEVSTTHPASSITHVLRRAAATGGHHAFRTAQGIVPAYPVHPLVELMHKMTALATAVVLVFASYAIVESDFRRHAAREIHSDVTSLRDKALIALSALHTLSQRADSWILEGEFQTAAANSIETF